MARTRSGFDWRTFWAMWDGFYGKIDYLALMASDANHEISGDWLEGWLRAEIKRRRSVASANGLLTDAAKQAQTG